MKISFQGPEEVKRLLLDQVHLRQDLIQRVIQRDFEGNTSAFGRSLELADLPHRKTILRWAKQQEGLPKSPQRLLALAQALDIDPFLLLEVDLERLLQACAAAAWNLTWGSVHKSLAFLNGLFSLVPEHWPPPELAEGFDGEWYCQEWLHQPQHERNLFKDFVVSPDACYGPDGDWQGLRDPQAWYLAFRELSFQSGEPVAVSYWRPFGILSLEQNQLRLLNLVGISESKSLEPTAEAFGFQLFFGPGAAQFRLASLHPFEADMLSSEAAQARQLATVTFGFPE